MKKKNTIFEAYQVLFKDYPDVVGVKEISEMLGICNKKVYKLLRNGEIPVIPCSKVYRVAKLNVIEYLLKSKETGNSTL